jgi:hypothetical protein
VVGVEGTEVIVWPIVGLFPISPVRRYCRYRNGKYRRRYDIGDTFSFPIRSPISLQLADIVSANIGETGKEYEIKCQNKEDYDDLIVRPLEQVGHGTGGC